jgi:large subunit ribosomal protein L10
VIKGGVLDGKPLTIDEISRIADLESREVLLAKMAGALMASLQNAAYLFNAPLAQVARLAGALQAKAEADPSVLAGGAGTPAPSSSDEPAPVEAVETETSDAATADEAPTDEAPAAAADVDPAPDTTANAEETPEG